jgi:hypothetical protein
VSHVPGWFCIHNLAFHLILTRRGGAFQLEVIGIRAKAVGIRASIHPKEIYYRSRDWVDLKLNRKKTEEVCHQKLEQNLLFLLWNLRDIRISKSGVRNKVRIPKCVGKVLYRLYLEVKLRKGRSSPWTISERRVLLWLIDVVCANWMGSRWTTFFFIARLLVLYGTPFLVVSVCLGFCPFGW